MTHTSSSIVHLNPWLIAASLTLAACQSKSEAPAQHAAEQTQSTQGSVSTADSAQAHALVQAGAQLLDVRSPKEYSESHIEGSINIPVGDLESRLPELDADKAVVVYCRSGRRASTAAQILAKEGFEVHNLGGMATWED